MLLPGLHAVTAGTLTASQATVTDVTRYRHLTTTDFDKASLTVFDYLGHRHLPEKAAPTVVQVSWTTGGDEDGLKITEDHFRCSRFGMNCITNVTMVASGGAGSNGINIQADDVIVYGVHIRAAEGGSGITNTVVITGIQVGDASSAPYRTDVIIRECSVIGSPNGVGAGTGIAYQTFSRRGELMNCVVADISGLNTSRGYFLNQTQDGTPPGTDNLKLYNCIAVNCQGPTATAGVCFGTTALFSDDSVSPVQKGYGNCICSDNSLFKDNQTGDGSFNDPNVDPTLQHESVAGFMPGAIWGISASNLFIDSRAQDFHAPPFSVGLDAGFDLDSVFTDATKGPGNANDVDDVARTGIFDVGLYTGFKTPVTATVTQVTSAIEASEGIGRDYSTIEQWIESLSKSPASDNKNYIGEMRSATGDFVPADKLDFIYTMTTRKKAVTLRSLAADRFRPFGAFTGVEVRGGQFTTSLDSFISIRINHLRLEGFGVINTTTNTVAQRSIRVLSDNVVLDSLFCQFADGTPSISDTINNVIVQVEGSRCLLENMILVGNPAVAPEGAARGILAFECDLFKAVGCLVYFIDGNIATPKGIHIGTNTRRSLVSSCISFGTGLGNKIMASEKLDDGAFWTQAGTGSIVANISTPVAPDGTMTAETLNDTDGASEFRISQTGVGLKLVAGDIWTQSIHVNEGTATDPGFKMNVAGSSDSAEVLYKWSTNTASLVTSGTPTSTSVFATAPDAAGWVRIEVRMAMQSTYTNILPQFRPAADAAASTGTTHAWGVQLERNPAATTYQANPLTSPALGADFFSESGQPEGDIVQFCSSGDNSARGIGRVGMLVATTYFVAHTANDFRNKPASPALSSGANLLFVTDEDFDNRARSAPLSRGAYEGFFSAPLRPPAPTNEAMTLSSLITATRTDGFTVRVTDNSEPVPYDGQNYEPTGGASISARREEAGLRPTTQQILGEIASDKITADDLAAGLWDRARVEIFILDPNFPFTTPLLTNVYELGQISHTDQEWNAEMVGALQKLKASTGDLVTIECPLELGGIKCGADIFEDIEPDVRVESFTDQRTFVAVAADIDGTKADDFFGNGPLTWITGANIGQTFRVKSSIQSTRVFTLTRKAPFTIVVGDRFMVKPGCRHRFVDCDTKFGNGPRFGGNESFPGGDRTLETS